MKIKGIVNQTDNQRFKFFIDVRLDYYINLLEYSVQKLEEELLTFENGESNQYSYEIDLYSSSLTILYESVFISLYGFLETEVINLIDSYAPEKKFSSTLKGKKSNSFEDGIENFLGKVLLIDATDLKDIFLKLGYFRKLRNAYVHNQGFTKDLNLINKSRTEFCLKVSELFRDHEIPIQKRVHIEDMSFIKIFSRFIADFIASIHGKLYPQSLL